MHYSVIYSTPSKRFGRHDWRIQVIEYEGSRKIWPVWRRIGDEVRWRLEKEFTGQRPKGLLELTFEYIEPIYRAKAHGEGNPWFEDKLE